ncbi:MAG: hypothetical protein R3F15_04750 [Lysobacterales bacterium]
MTTYFRYGDAFHPAVFIAPLMFAGYCLWPLVLNRSGDLEFLLGSEDSARVQGYYLAGLTAFFLSLSSGSSQRLLRQRQLSPWQSLLSTVRGQQARRKLMKLAMLLSCVALAAYWYSILNAGGFDLAYSRYKGGGYAESGYVGEAALLAYPAVLIYALTRQGKGFGPIDWLLVLAMISPNLFQGTFGVRRGPLFISLAILFVSWVVARGRVPGLVRTVLVVASILLAVGFVWTQRQVWFSDDPAAEGRSGLGSTFLPSTDELWQNDYVSGMGSALITEYYDEYFWGKRWFVDLVIRPIPRQIWPNKYADVGAHWKEGANPTGFDELAQIHVLGFPLPSGHSIGVLSDLYSEWSWGALFFLALLGWFLRWLWFKHRTIGQVWTVLFLVAIGLCVYLPTQSFSAFYQRFLIMAIGSFVAWRWVVGKDVRATREATSAVLDEPLPDHGQGLGSGRRAPAVSGGRRIR